MVVVCAQREGLVVALSRLVCAGAAPETLTARTRACAAVFGRLLAATRAGATGADVYAAAARAYAEVGFPGEERRHHQGGAIGYRAREWVAHPNGADVVTPPQAFAWNPSITGTKIEDTCLLDGTVEAITASPGWPSIPLADVPVQAPDVLEI
jgi:antitoxin VapB